MADKLFDFTILCPEKTVYKAQIASLIAPCDRGYLGVLADHAPLLAAVVPGTLTVRTAHTVKTFTVKEGGFLEAAQNNVTVLAKAVEPTA